MRWWRRRKSTVSTNFCKSLIFKAAFVCSKKKRMLIRTVMMYLYLRSMFVGNINHQKKAAHHTLGTDTQSVSLSAVEIRAWNHPRFAIDWAFDRTVSRHREMMCMLVGGGGGGGVGGGGLRWWYARICMYRVCVCVCVLCWWWWWCCVGPKKKMRAKHRISFSHGCARTTDSVRHWGWPSTRPTSLQTHSYTSIYTGTNLQTIWSRTVLSWSIYINLE